MCVCVREQVDGDEMQPKGQQHALCLSRLGCEEYHEQYTCKSFTPFMCLDELRRTSVAPGKMGETDVRDCTVVDEKGKPEAGEAGYCTCSDKEGANIMLGVRGCGGYSETTCKARAYAIHTQYKHTYFHTRGQVKVPRRA